MQRKNWIVKTADALRDTLPTPIWNLLRKPLNAFLGPCHFAIETGHLFSAALSRPMDFHGNPLPWYTYPAIQFLMSANFRDKRILEWGIGASTLFWAKRAAEVVGFESSPQWIERTRPKLPPSAQVHEISRNLDGFDFLKIGKFDLIVIDGLNREKCANVSLDLLAEPGAIIIDDSERLLREPEKSTFLDEYLKAGLSRIDFYGYSPGNTLQHCTSVFLKHDCFLLDPRRPVTVPLTRWDIH